MNLKLRFALLALLVCFGMLIDFSGVVIASNPIVAQIPNVSFRVSAIAKGAPLVNAMETEANNYYAQGKLTEAIKVWKQAIEVYILKKDLISQSRVLSNLALAYQQLGKWQEARTAIKDSLNLLASYEDIEEENLERNRILAQVLNNQGVLQLAQGDASAALLSWSQATKIYEKIGDRDSVIRSQINQVNALKSLGLYHRALEILTQVNQVLATEPNSIIKAVELRSYGDILRLTGELNQAQEILQRSLEIFSQFEFPIEQAKTLLVLGKIMKAQEQQERAFQLYQQGLIICQKNRFCLNTNLPLQIHLAQLSLLLTTKDWQKAGQLLPEITIKINHLTPSRSNIYQEIHFIHLLLQLEQKIALEKVTLVNFPSWKKIKEILSKIEQKARKLADYRAESYALGLQGQVSERLAQWVDGEKYSKQALHLAQTINAPEISYLWQWQLGKILQKQGKSQDAIAYYIQAVATLKSLSQDLVAINPDLQYSFHESVEPVYRELVSLLLQPTNNQTISQANLSQARDTIESLQLAELHNFFREACLDVKPISIDRIDRHAAVIYPIILRDRLEVIVSLPGKLLRHYTTFVTQSQLEQVIKKLQQTVVIRSRRDFYEPGQKLYNWLIRPVLADLIKNKIETLVFVPDGTLRNIPLSVLYDGKNYLIEQYNIALTPGLQLLTPRPVEQIAFKTLAAGLTKQRQRFAPLNYVNLELEKIKQQTETVVLLDHEFTKEALQKKIEFSNFPIVHIATHGQFSSVLDETFLLAWDSRIKINQLDQILKTRTSNKQSAIELLVLSACETAAGDKWAALGLAGIAVRAGARSTLATLWAVNDRSSAELMDRFYQELTKKQVNKAQAIRQAQLTLLKNPRYKHPFYWAAYVLLGNWL